MADQPLNAEISIFRTVRGQRENLRTDSVKNITSWLRGLVLVEPGREVRTEVKARDAAVTDFSAYMGQARYSPPTTPGPWNTGRGLPVTIGARTWKDFNHVNNMTGIDFPAEIGHDRIVSEDAAHVGGDIHQDARDS